MQGLMGKGRSSKGRQKIEIKRIKNEEARQVTFSKRRTGLFKKASELSILCGVEIAAVVFSPAGKAFSFGHPSVDSIIDRFVSGSGSSVPPGHHGANMHQHGEMLSKLEVEKKRCDALEEALKGVQAEKPYWWNANLNHLGLEELEQLRREMVELRNTVAQRADQLLLEASARKAMYLAGNTMPSTIAMPTGMATAYPVTKDGALHMPYQEIIKNKQASHMMMPYQEIQTEKAPHIPYQDGYNMSMGFDMAPRDLIWAPPLSASPISGSNELHLSHLRA